MIEFIGHKWHSRTVANIQKRYYGYESYVYAITAVFNGKRKALYIGTSASMNNRMKVHFVLRNMKYNNVSDRVEILYRKVSKYPFSVERGLILKYMPPFNECGGFAGRQYKIENVWSDFGIPEPSVIYK